MERLKLQVRYPNNSLDYDNFALLEVVVETKQKFQSQDAHGPQGIDPGAPSQDATSQRKRKDHEVNIDKESKEE